MDAAWKSGKASRRGLRGPDLADSVAGPTVDESRKLFDECFIILVKAAWLGAGLLEPVQHLRAAGGALTSLFEWPLGAKQGWCSAMGWRGAEAWSTLPAYYRTADYPPAQ
jgi:hypothetical protein